MNLKVMIAAIHNRQKSINHLVDELGKNWGDEQRVLSLFLGAPDYCLSHPKVINMLADFLQCIDNKPLLSHFDLDDIEKLYRLNLEILPNELSQYEDLSHYYTNVQDDEAKSSWVLEEGVKNSNAILNNLNELKKGVE